MQERQRSWSVVWTWTSSVEDGAWKLALTLQGVQAHTIDHCLSCIYSRSFLLHCFYPSQEPPDTFFNWFSMITRSSALQPSQGTPVQNSRDKASSTMMNRRLSTEPWWTPTYTSISLLYPSPTRTWLHSLAYIPCTSRTIHASTPSFLSTHQMTFWGIGSNAFSRSTKAM